MAVALDILAIHINTNIIPKFCLFYGVIGVYNGDLDHTAEVSGEPCSLSCAASAGCAIPL